MENAILVGLSRQTVLERQIDVVANNIANLNTTGFKALSSVFQEYLNPTARDAAAVPADARVHFVFDRTSYRTGCQGPVPHTGNPLDVAINGDGFLSVQTPGGERFTR